MNDAMLYFRKKKERGKKGKKPARMKSEVHRQQWFKNKIKSKKSASARGKKTKKWPGQFVLHLYTQFLVIVTCCWFVEKSTWK